MIVYDHCVAIDDNFDDNACDVYHGFSDIDAQIEIIISNLLGIIKEINL